MIVTTRATLFVISVDLARLTTISSSEVGLPFCNPRSVNGQRPPREPRRPAMTSAIAPSLIYVSRPSSSSRFLYVSRRKVFGFRIGTCPRTDACTGACLHASTFRISSFCAAYCALDVQTPGGSTRHRGTNNMRGNGDATLVARGRVFKSAGFNTPGDG